VNGYRGYGSQTPGIFSAAPRRSQRFRPSSTLQLELLRRSACRDILVHRAITAIRRLARTRFRTLRLHPALATEAFRYDAVAASVLPIRAAEAERLRCPLDAGCAWQTSQADASDAADRLPLRSDGEGRYAMD